MICFARLGWPTDKPETHIRLPRVHLVRAECAVIISMPVEPFQRLAAELDQAFHALNDRPTLDRTELERTRYVLALNAVARFLDGIKGFERYADKFVELATVLSDLDNGTQAPLLSPKHVDNRAPESSQKWIGRAHAALSLEALRHTGQSRSTAAATIAADHRGLEALATKKPKSLKTALIWWHSEFAGSRIKNDLALKPFLVGQWHIKELAAISNDVAAFRDIANKSLVEASRIAAGLSPAS